MRNSSKKYFSLLLVFIFVLFYGAMGQASEISKKISNKKNELSSVRSKAQDTRKQLREYKIQERNVLNDLETLEKNMAGRREQLLDLNKQLSRNKHNVCLTEEKLQKAQIRLNEQTDLLNIRLRDTYKNGNTSYLEVLLGAEDFADFLSRLDYLSLIIKQDVFLLQQIERQKAKIEQEKILLEKKRKAIVQIQHVVETKKQELVNEQEEKNYILSKVQKEKAAYEQALNELEQTSIQLQGMIKRLQSQASYKPRFKKRGINSSNSSVTHGTGRMCWPNRGTITSSFGYRVHPIFGTRKLHTGLDISNRHGAPIVAADEGRVIYSGWMSGYGQAIIIDHGGGISTLYGHCSALLVSNGTIVRQGQLIARVGSTGFSTGPHVHFEVRVGGSPVNPLGYL